MTRIAWFHCFSGIAGDMALGALLDAGVDQDELMKLVRRLPVDNWTFEVEEVLRGGIAATKVHVRTNETGIHRTASQIKEIIKLAALPERVASRALGVFKVLAEAEGKIHRQTPEQVHFHEVGAVDSIVDIVGVCSALEILAVDEIYSSPVALGLGKTTSAHGVIPVPAPAVLRLLVGIPTTNTGVPYELTTPTGAALMNFLVTGWGGMPDMVIERDGFGAGQRDSDGLPNLVQTVIGESTTVSSVGHPVFLFEVNIDDATGETLAHSITKCLEVGAYDAWVTPIVMKKGRPGYLMSVLCNPSNIVEIRETLTKETGSFGVRGQTLERWPAARTMDYVEVAGHRVGVKVSSDRVKIEYDDAVRVAEIVDLSIREVISLAEETWRKSLLD